MLSRRQTRDLNKRSNTARNISVLVVFTNVSNSSWIQGGTEKLPVFYLNNNQTLQEKQMFSLHSDKVLSAYLAAGWQRMW